MTPLRQQMITAMQMHGFSPRTHESYLAAVRDLAKFTRRSSDLLAHADLTRYFEHLVVQRRLAPASVRLMYNGIRFFYLKVLGWPTVALEVTLPKRPQRIPELLTRGAVAAILAACDDPRLRTMLTVCYGCGLRLSEVLALRVQDIDGERRLLRITQGKGAKDRLVPLSPTLLEELRADWRLYRPADWLFAGRTGEPLCASTLQRASTDAKQAAGVTTVGGIHGLRHNAALRIIPSLLIDKRQPRRGSGKTIKSTRHNHRLLRKANSSSSGRYRGSRTFEGVVLASASSFSSRSACR
jgi:integrase/recombinase XerD